MARRVWTDEDAAYAAAQWASGIRMKDVAAAFGYKGGSAVCGRILNFTRKYCPPVESQPWHEEFAREWNGGRPYHAPILWNDPANVKAALAVFVKQRNGQHRE